MDIFYVESKKQMTVFVWPEDKIGIILGLPACEGYNGYRRRNNTYETAGWEKSRVNYEYKRQNNWQQQKTVSVSQRIIPVRQEIMDHWD